MNFDELPTSADEAIAQGLKQFFNGKPCRNGHVAPRWIHRDTPCVECDRIRKEKHRSKGAPSATFAAFIEAARAAGEKTFFTGQPCKNGHLAPRYAFVRSNPCIECARSREKASKSKNPDRFIELRRRRDKRRYQRIMSESPEVLRQKAVKTRQANPERARAWNRKWQQSFKADDPQRFRAIYAANAQKRNAIKLKATPAWADLEKIREFYDTAAALNMLTGEWHHVDHIVPLRSNTVCGLHVHTNLRITTAAENLSKGNRYDPDAALGI